jgi:GNAT superfamily N-acetyltransferase
MIRTARLDDAAAIAAMSGQLGYPATTEQIRGRLEVVLNREDMGTFVAEEEGVVVGWIHMFGCERIESEPSAEIGGLVVADGHRGAGLGAQLVAAGERWAQGRDYGAVRVRSNVLREHAHRFYQREGYEPVKRQTVFLKTLAGRRPPGV